jgi:Cof subfamily protein (haloacid dehalogenase superfamily)
VARVVRLVCIDVDGTLVGSSGIVPPGVWEAAERLRVRGIRLAICSGRPAFGKARDYATRLDSGGWHIFQNGASVVHLATGESLSAPIDPPIIALLVERARRPRRILELYTDSEYAVESQSEVAREHAALMGLPFAPRPFESLKGPVVRAQWLLAREDTAAVLSEPHSGLEVSPSGAPGMPAVTFVGLTRAGVSKASGVRTVARAYGVDLEETMYVGDGHNDIGAMRAVGSPVAMGNADGEVKAAARIRVGDVDSGGLEEALAAALG